MRLSRAWVWLVVAFILLGVTATPDSHTPIESRWNYNEHLFPLFRDRCGNCHIEGGVAHVVSRINRRCR